MRLLVVSQYYWPEPFRITEICESLVQRGHSVDVLTSLPNIPEGKFYDGYGPFKPYEKTHNGVNIERVGVVQRGRDSSLRLTLNCASFALNSLFHLPKLKKNDYDAVFVFNNSPVSKILPAMRFAKAKNIPNVVWILDIWPESMYFLLGMPDDAPDSWFKRTSYAVSRWLYKSADMLLISSEGFDEKLRKMGLTAPIEYYPNFAERPPKTDFSVTRGELGLSDGDFVVGFSGNVGKAQGLEALVEAAKRQKAGGDNTKWLIVGDGSERVSLENAARENGVEDRIVFAGWVSAEKVNAYLSLCDALLVPLKDSEVLNLTVPAKLQTYMSAAKPVIAFMNGAGASLTEECGCGVTAPAGDIGALCEAVETLRSKDKAQLERMGRAGKEYCEKHFDRDELIERLEKLLNTAIENHEKR